MHRRHQSTNVPTEIVRTIVMIAALGSFSRAGERLGLSQAAISAQVKRFQLLVGGEVFERVPGGVALTQRGELMIEQARVMLAANDQLLLLGGAVTEAKAIRIGVATLFAKRLLPACNAIPESQQIYFCSDRSHELMRQLGDGSGRRVRVEPVAYYRQDRERVGGSVRLDAIAGLCLGTWRADPVGRLDR